MIKYREFRWKIDAYSAETMPLDRLLAYLRELSTILGQEANLHLVRVETGSTQPVFKVPPDAVPLVQKRALAVRIGMATPEAKQSYRKINKMLREDRTKAVFLEETAAILLFPGVDEPARHISGIQQHGSLDGRLVSVGGRRSWVPLQLETPERILTGIYARRQLAKAIGPYLFEPIRLLGQGRWSRTEDGEWVLDYFAANAFDRLEDETLPHVVAGLRNIRAQWPDDPIGELQALRNGNGERD